MMLRNVISRLPDSPKRVIYPELLHELSKLLNACPLNHKPGSSRMFTTRERISHSTSATTASLDWLESIKLFRWITSATLAMLTTDRTDDLSNLHYFLSTVDELLTRCRDQRILPPSEQIPFSITEAFAEVLNQLLKQLCQLLRNLSDMGQLIEINSTARLECYNLTSKTIGHLLLGNLTQVDPNLLSDLASQFVSELSLRRAATDLLQSSPIYVTLSHLTYLHAVWDKTQDSTSALNSQLLQFQSTDFLAQAPTLHESMMEAFTECLKRCDPSVLRTAQHETTTDRSAAIRHVVMASLNGLSQLLLRRAPKPSAAVLPSLVRVLWSHVLVFSRQSASNKRGGALYADTGSGASSPTSSSSSLPTTSDEETASPHSPRPNRSYALPEWSASDLPSYLNDSSCGLPRHESHANSFYSSSEEDESNSCALVPGTTEAIASGLLTGSPLSAQYRPSLHRRRDPPHRRAENVDLRGKDRLDSTGRPHPAPSGFSNQLKPYALSVFCLKRLLDGCRSQSALDLWPVLMCCDAWANMSHSSDVRSSLSVPTTSTERSTATMAPDLLTLVYKTSDIRIRKMLVEVFVSLLASVGKRFAIAEDLTPHSASFVPYSVRLAVELRHLHRRLILALYSEKSIVLQGLLLKALTTLVLITPYPRLQPGLLTSLLPVLHQLVNLTGTHNRVVDLRAGCLSLLGNILGRVPGPLLEVCQILSDDSRAVTDSAAPFAPTVPDTSTTRLRAPATLGWSAQTSDRTRGPGYWSGTQSQDPFSPCWLVQVCLRLIHPNVSSFAWDQTTQPTESNCAGFQGPTNSTELGGSASAARHFQPPPVRVQALIVLRSMVPNYVAFLRPSLPLIRKTLLFCLQDSNKTKLLWSPALKFLLVFLPFLQTDSADTNNSLGTDSLTWWRDFIPPMVHILRNSKENSDRSYVCKVLSCMDSTILENIRIEDNSDCSVDSIVNALKLAVEDEDELLQARAIRTLGALIVLGPLQNNLSLLTNLIERAETVWNKASIQSVGLDLAWSLANCLEVIAAHKLGLIPNGLEWNSVVQELDRLGMDWDKLVATCCELCALHPLEPDMMMAQNPKYGKQRELENITTPSVYAQTTGNSTTVTASAAMTDGLHDNPKSPDAHRCENGARALGYLFRILSPGLIQDQKMINLLFESMCEAMVTSKASSAEKIRWNANFAVGHLFQNTDLWRWWSTHFTTIGTTGHPDKASDPLCSSETAQLVAKLIRNLCYTFGNDKYFKARVYAANSLLNIFIRDSVDEPANILHILDSQLLSIATGPDPPMLEFAILDVAFAIVRQVHDGTADAPCCVEYGNSDRASHTSLHQVGAHHMSEIQYRQQCLCLATTLLFFSLTSWFTYAVKQQQQHHKLHSRDLQAELEHQLTHSWLCPVVLSHLARLLHNCMVNQHGTLESDCKPETIYPRPTIVSHLLELNDKMSPNKRLHQAVQLFQSRIPVSQCNSPAVQQLRQLVQEAQNPTDPTIHCLTESQSKLSLISQPSDASQFRQIYD